MFATEYVPSESVTTQIRNYEALELLFGSKDDNLLCMLAGLVLTAEEYGLVPA